MAAAGGRATHKKRKLKCRGEEELFFKKTVWRRNEKDDKTNTTFTVATKTIF